MGEIVTVDLDEDVREDIYDHVFSSLDREVGGVLLGPGDDDGPVRITARIEALNADNRQASVTFTHESWTAIYDEMAARYPSLKIVGWYHSHPGFGIFLSSDDLFIQANFFSGERQLAYVVDPRAGTEGFFGWEDGEIVKLSEGDTSREAGVLDERSKLDLGDLDDVQEDGPPPPPEHKRRGRAAVPAILALVVGLGAGGAAAAALIKPTPEPNPDELAVLRSQNLELQRQVEAKQQEINELSQKAPAAENETYTVKSGDTLAAISKRFYGTETKVWLIAGMNGITDPNDVGEGQKLTILPKSVISGIGNPGNSGEETQ